LLVGAAAGTLVHQMVSLGSPSRRGDFGYLDGDAAGEDPSRYDVALALEMEATPLPPNVIGYRLGGIGRRADVPYHDYQR
jgi:hypothetical protein